MPSLIDQLREALGPQYKLDRELGGGGMGTVFLALDTMLDRSIAVKVVCADRASPTAAQRFLNEARTLARLRHPNIVSVHNAGQFGDCVYYVMDYIDGQTLEQRMAEGILSREETVRLGDELLQALEAAHEQGIVHRDVKPSNVFMENGRALLGDFGISKRIETASTSLTSPGERVGTPGYMAPEQAAGEEVTSATDTYAVGMILYEALTGRRWSLLTPQDQVDWSGVPPRFVSVLRRALEWVPRDRWSDAATFREALVHAQRRRFARRAVVAMVATIMVALSSATAWFLLRTDRGHPAVIPTYTQLTFDGAANAPAISPDGEYLAYISGERGAEQRLMLQELAKGVAFDAGSHDGLQSLRWSPDGSELVFNTRTGTFLLPRFSGTPERLPVALYPSWSPDGSQLASMRPTRTGDGWALSTIGFVSLSTGDTSSIMLPDSFLLGSPELYDINWSTEGNWIAFGIRDSNGYAIGMTSVDGTEQRRLIQDSVPLSSPRWSLGGAIYYLRGWESHELWKISVSQDGKLEGAPTFLLAGLEVGGGLGGFASSSFTLSSDARRLVFARPIRHSNLWLQTAQGLRRNQPAPLTSGTGDKGEPSISPDGTQAAFRERQAAGSSISIVSFDGGAVQRLTTSGSYNGRPVWSPNGEEIAFVSDRDGSHRVWVVDVRDGTLRKYGETVVASFHTLAWSPGIEILYPRARTGDYYVLDPATGEERPLVVKDSAEWLSGARYAPDGRQVAVTWERAGSPGIWVLNPDDGSKMLIREGTRSSVPISWSADGEAVLAYDYDGTSVSILSIPIVGGEPDLIATLPLEGVEWPAQVSVSGDAARIVYSKEDIQSDLWLVENFDRERG